MCERPLNSVIRKIASNLLDGCCVWRVAVDVWHGLQQSRVDHWRVSNSRFKRLSISSLTLVLVSRASRSALASYVAKITMLTWPMLTQHSCCLLQRQPAAGPTLGSELAGTMLCGLQLLLLSISHARQLTFAPRTPAPPRKHCRVRLP